MWGTILSAAAQGAGYLMDYFRGKQQQQQADAAAARQEAHYTAKANENPLSRSENQYLLGQYDRDAQQQIENARGVAAITGATPEYGLAVQKAAANGRANLMGHMAAGASERADEYEQKAEDVRHAKEVADQERTAQQRASIATMVSNAAIPIGEFADSYLGGAKKAPAASVGGGAFDPNKSKIATSRAAQLRAGAEAATSPVEKQVLTDTADAAENAQKMATATAPAKPQLAAGSSVQLANSGYVDAGDGTWVKDGVKYYRNFDGSYTMVK